MAFDPEALRKLIAETGDYEAYNEEVAKALATEPREYYLKQKRYLKLQIDKYSLLIQPLPGDRLAMIGKALLALWKIIKEAQLGDWEGYLAFHQGSTDSSILDMEGMRRILRGSRPRAGEDWTRHVVKMLNDLDEGLNIYQRRVSYYAGLALIGAAETARLDGLANWNVVSLESRIAGVAGTPPVLGNEYRHIRNALGHRSVRVLDGKRALEFRDRNIRTGAVWKRVYTFDEFGNVYTKVADWLVADGVAKALEGILVFAVFERSLDRS